MVYGVSTNANYTLDDSLEVYGNNTYRYDSDGYLIEKTTPTQTTTYTYNTLGALTQVQTPTKTINYHLNANNQRVAKEVNGTIVEKYFWSNLTTLLATYDSNDNLIQRFNYTDSRTPTSMTMNSETYYLHYDQVGTLKAISNNQHQIVKEITYDTFGNILQDTNKNIKVPFGFAGGLHDTDTKLVHFGYREYDPYTGKWTAKDPIDFGGGDSNLYGYVLGDPVGFIDPEGLMSMKPVFDGAGGVSDFIDNYRNMRDANTIGADKYFHCMANCEATNRGKAGQSVAEGLSNSREWLDENFKGDTSKACGEDQVANKHGRKGGNCKQRCARFRPKGLGSQW